MKSTKLALVVVCCVAGLFLARRVSAQTGTTPTELPAIVTNGLNAYLKIDSKAAVAAWLKSSGVNIDEGKDKLDSVLSQMEAQAGKMVGYEAIQVVTLAPSLQRVYVLMKYEKRPLYASFECYKSPGGWAITHYDFNTKADAVLPPSMLGGSGR